jgi:hypothetical protein
MTPAESSSEARGFITTGYFTGNSNSERGGEACGLVFVEGAEYSVVFRQDQPRTIRYERVTMR